MALNPQQAQVGRMLYGLAVQRGVPPQRAREFVSAALAESGLRPGAVNSSSGAGGLFQLLSPGYRQRAQQLGGIQNPRANALAILPDYQRYWQQHPHAAPGEAGAGVERSGQGAGFYSRGLGQLGNLGGGPTSAPSPAQAPPGAPAAPGPQQTGLALIQALQPGPQHGDYSGVFQAIHQRAQAHAQELAQHIIQTARSSKLGTAILAPGADRPGVTTSPAVLAFVRKIAGLAREPLNIATGTQHSRLTVNGRVSDHWSGHAADIPATGVALVHLGRLALIAAGADPKWAMRQNGGLYNIGGHQVIFNTHIGGDHTNHLHVSAH